MGNCTSSRDQTYHKGKDYPTQMMHNPKEFRELNTKTIKIHE
jgi:hypothetical protein